MNLSNRCPKCGGVANHVITDIDGNNYYQCITGLTSFRKEGREIVRESYIVPCDTMLDQQGGVFSGTVAYVSNNRVNTLVVSKGGN